MGRRGDGGVQIRARLPKSGIDGSERAILGLFAAGDWSWHRLPILRVAARAWRKAESSESVPGRIALSLACRRHPPTGQPLRWIAKAWVPSTVEGTRSNPV